MKRLNAFLFLAIYSFSHNICNAENAEKKLGNIELATQTLNEFNSAINVSVALDTIIDDTIDGRDKIVGGVKSTKGEFPWMVGIWRMKSLRPFCGGSLLNNRCVLVFKLNLLLILK